ncbi:hypothetical protein M3Y98_00075200 [Aphelenchoides besseyi]|nr:hypothetical protein M3Y98_00075200 [Aphelenchoides besseyi]KAI6198717.1 hypothetical protein M3Y96_00549100 [Aphelenchoides besseyi]
MLSNRWVYCFLSLSAVLFVIVESFGLPMGGGGGGCGGGGGGCCSPAPMMCGCGRRKKRSVIEPQIWTEESAPCPQLAWKPIIEGSVTNDLTNSKYAVQNALFKTYETKFLITCAKTENKHHLQFVTNGEGYCTAGNNQIWCAAIVLQA